MSARLQIISELVKFIECVFSREYVRSFILRLKILDQPLLLCYWDKLPIAWRAL